ncbi:MAG: DnaA regulatory inactivator Hda [Alysiella sp.]|uniref:DnaA regulatory inactivator Hda n=1 Tax=Alysiella sp. TaxID=1872483 RepID=UPI0026DAFCAA|nr:DnaA regulatory inactivator Hda [Alysiella sp.]MDO4433078.1 DnaA regulatory inactivator Hda [Alysiella sp.]
MNQLLLDLNAPAYPRFDKLLGTANAELIFMLQQEHDPFLYIWGGQGTGKSHILQAWVGQALQNGKNALYIDPAVNMLTDHAAEVDYLAIDQIEQLNAEEQAELFYVFNTFRNRKRGHLLLAAEVPPSKLNVREDLRTRMSLCLSYEVKALSQDEKIAALSHLATTRQFNIDPNIYHYLITHWRQDLQSLLTMFNDLAHYSMIQRKPITLSLLKKLLQQETP